MCVYMTSMWHQEEKDVCWKSISFDLQGKGSKFLKRIALSLEPRDQYRHCLIQNIVFNTQIETKLKCKNNANNVTDHFIYRDKSKLPKNRLIFDILSIK